MIFIKALLLGPLTLLAAMEARRHLRMYSKSMSEDTPYMLITRDHHACLDAGVLDMDYLPEIGHPLCMETGLLFLQGAAFARLVSDLPGDIVPETLAVHLRPVAAKPLNLVSKLKAYKQVSHCICSITLMF